jgi:CBS domain-containing protein
MTAAREFMHIGADCIGEDETLSFAAQRMRDLHVGSLPICGADDRLHGIITDRDIVVRCIAEGYDPRMTTTGEMARGTPIWVGADTDSSEVVAVMTANRIRRVPVLENRRVVGMISEADVATHLDERTVSQFASAISAAPPNS